MPSSQNSQPDLLSQLARLSTQNKLLYEKVAHFSARKGVVRNTRENRSLGTHVDEGKARRSSRKSQSATDEESRMQQRHSRHQSVEMEPSTHRHSRHQSIDESAAPIQKHPSPQKPKQQHQMIGVSIPHVNSTNFDTPTPGSPSSEILLRQLKATEERLAEVIEQQNQEALERAAPQKYSDADYEHLQDKYNALKVQVQELKQFRDDHLYNTDTAAEAHREQLMQLKEQLNLMEESEQAAVETQKILKEQNQHLKQQLAALEAQKGDNGQISEEEHAHLRVRVEEYEQRIKGMEAQALSDAKEMNQKFKWYIETHKTLKQENSSLQEQLRSFAESSNLESTQNDLRRAHEEIESLQHEMSILRETSTRRENELKSQLRDSMSSSHIMLNQSSILPVTDTTSEYVQTVQDTKFEQQQTEDNSITELRETITTLDRENTEFKRKYSTAIADKAKMQVEIEKLTEELAALRTQQLVKSSKTPLSPSDDPNVISQSLQEEIATMRSFCDQAVIHIENLKAEVINLHMTNDTLQKELKAHLAGSESSALVEQFSKTQEELTKLHSDKISLTHHVEGLDARIIMLEGELAKSTATRTELEEAHEYQMETLKERLNEETALRKVQDAFNMDLTEQLETLQKATQGLKDAHRAEVARLTKQIQDYSEMETTTDMYKEKVDQLQQKLDMVKTNSHQLEQKHSSQVDSLGSTIQQLRDEIEAAQTDRSQMEKQLQASQREKQKLQTSLQEAREALALIQDDMHSQHSSHSTPDASVVEFYKGQIERLKQDKADLQQQLTDLAQYQENTLDQMRAETQALRKQLLEKNAKAEHPHSALQAELEAALQEKADLEQQLHEMRDSLEEDEAQHAALHVAHKEDMRKLREKYQEKMQQLKESHEFSLREYRSKLKQLNDARNAHAEGETSMEALDEAHMEIEALTQQVNSLRASADAAAVVQEQFEKLQKEYDTLLEHNKTLRDQVLQEAREMQDSVLTQLQEEMKADQAKEIKNIRQVVEREQQKAQAQIEALQEELAISKEKERSNDTEKDKLIQELRSQIVTLRQRIQQLHAEHEEELNLLEQELNKELNAVSKKLEMQHIHHRLEMDELLNKKNEDLVTYAIAVDTVPRPEFKRLQHELAQKSDDMERLQTEYDDKVRELRAEIEVAQRADDVVKQYETSIKELNEQADQKIASLTDELTSVKKLLARSKIERGSEDDIEKLKRELSLEQQAHRTNRSQDMFEISRLRKQLADLTEQHETQLKEYEQKHLQAMEELTHTQNQNTVIRLLKSKLYEERERTKHFEDELFLTKDQLLVEQRSHRADIERLQEEVHHLTEQLRKTHAGNVESKEKLLPLQSLNGFGSAQLQTPASPSVRTDATPATRAPLRVTPATPAAPQYSDIHPKQEVSALLTPLSIAETQAMTPTPGTPPHHFMQRVADAFRSTIQSESTSSTPLTQAQLDTIANENPFMKKIRSQAQEIIALRSKMDELTSPASSATNQELIQRIETLQHKAEENTLLMMSSFQKQLDDLKSHTSPTETNVALLDKLKVSKSDAIKKAKLLIKEAQSNIQSEYERKIVEFKRQQRLELGRVREEYERAAVSEDAEHKGKRRSSKKKKSERPERKHKSKPPHHEEALRVDDRDFERSQELLIRESEGSSPNSAHSFPHHFPHTPTPATPQSHQSVTPKSGTDAAAAFLRATNLIMTQQAIVKKFRKKKRMQHTINDIEFSPDGKVLVVASGNMVVMYDAVKQMVLKRLDPKCSYVGAVAFSPDGKHFASGGSMPQHAVVIWNSEGKGLLRYPNRSFINCLSYNPTYGTLLSGTEFNFGVYSMGWKNVVKYPVESKLMCFSWSCRGNLLALGHENGEVMVRDAITKDAKSGECAYYILDTVQKADAISTMSWHPSQDILAVGCMDKTLSFFRFHQGKLYSLGDRQLGFRPFGMTFVTNGKFMCIGGSNNKACLYSSTGDVLMNIIASDRLVKVIVSNPKSDIVAISDHTKIVFADVKERLEASLGRRLWNAQRGSGLFMDVVVRCVG